MPYSESQKKASRKYNESNYKRVHMYLYPETKQEWESAAKLENMNLSEFIKMCVSEHLKREKPDRTG